MHLNNYHDIPALSASGINDWHKAPIYYWHRSPFNKERAAQKESEALSFGKLMHCMLFEEVEVDNRFIASIKVDRRTKAGKAAYHVFLQLSEGKTIVKQEDIEKARAMREALYAHPKVHELIFQGGEAEKEIYWESHGLPCKAKLDFIKGDTIIDYKTTDKWNYHEFQKSFTNYGYHRQASWYMDAYEQLKGDDAKEFILIVQHKDIPELIDVYRIDEHSIDVGRYENDIAREDITKRLDSGIWHDVDDSIKSIGFPDYYRTRAI